jgi:dimeric dUTPase (all-alpha-NTP-PPase superfamily)
MNKQELVKLFDECMRMQGTFNSVVNPDWKKANYNWRRAMWVEAAELCDHLGYKWWKNVDATYDKHQALLEVVDIFHFMLSESIIGSRTPEDMYYSYEWATKHVYAPTKERKLAQVEEFVASCLDHSPIQSSFFQVMLVLDVSIESLLKYYIGKNALNKFRQDNGYKEGTYRKMWAWNTGELLEDNKVLELLIESINQPTTFDTVYNELKTIYASNA